MIDPYHDPEFEPRVAIKIRTAFWAAEQLLYVIVGLLLLAAAALVVVGTITGLVNGIRGHQSAVTIGVGVLDQVLLTLIVAELLHTLRFVVLRGQIVAEPFLFVGLIAVVRRVLIVTAELERQTPSGHALTNQLLELGLLGFLALALAVAIYLVRRSDPASSEQSAAGTGSSATLPA